MPDSQQRIPQSHHPCRTAPRQSGMASHPYHEARRKGGSIVSLQSIRAAGHDVAAKERSSNMQKSDIKYPGKVGSGAALPGRQTHAGHQKRETGSFGNTLVDWRVATVSLISCFCGDCLYMNNVTPALPSFLHASLDRTHLCPSLLYSLFFQCYCAFPNVTPFSTL
jgi:hypothetical protein